MSAVESLRDDTDAIELALEELVLMADEARQDVAAFFEFVMREEETNEPIVIAPHQELILQFQREHERSVTLIPIGHGKCHGRGTPIMMADGSTKCVEAVRPGDRLMGPHGPKVVRSVSSGRGHLYRVSPKRGGDAFIANADHLLTLVGPKGELEDVSIVDYLQRSKWYRARHFLLRSCVERFENERRLGIDPYFLGVWFGDGNHSLRLGVRMTSIDREVRDACLRVAREHGLVIAERKDGQSFALVLPGGKGAQLGRGNASNPLVAKMRMLVGESLSMERIKTAPWYERLEFLAGFLDADAHLRDNCFYVFQKRVDWSRDIVFIARSLGFSATIREGKTSWHHKGERRTGRCSRICIYGDVDRILTRIPRKRTSRRLIGSNALWTGFRVEPIGEGDYYGFTIDGDGRYLLGDFTVTHNTYTATGAMLYELGVDPMMRGAIVSLAQGQAEKPVSMVRQYVETSAELQMVFPELRPTQRGGEPWTTTDLTIDRPPGIRDPSLVARGLDSQRVLGSRWKRLFVDDLIDGDNSRTPEGREKVWEHFRKKLMTRVDPKRGSVAVQGTAWHPDDVLHRLMNPRPLGAGWPGLVMRADGTILILNDPNWDSPLIRPADARRADDPMAEYRLVAHDPDPHHLVPLWPERWSVAKLAEERAELPAAYYNQIYLNICRDDTTSLCKQDDIEKGKALARQLGIHGFVPRLEGGAGMLVFTGVDLAFSKAASADECAIFTFAVYPDRTRVPLWIDHGKWGTAELADRIADHNDRYHPAGISFESNAAQEGVRQMMVKLNKALPLKPYVTNGSKHKIEYGVPVIFTEFANGAWAIPNSKEGAVNPAVKKWLDQCLYYVPSEHTGDILMAQFFALQLAKRYGALAKPPVGGAAPRIAANIMSR